MGRFPQRRATLGSMKWLQVLINERPALVNDQLAGLLKCAASDVRWRSPLGNDNFSEYRDQCALDRLGAGLVHQRLPMFWPARGPQWDALGTAGPKSEKHILVEAKAHLGEFCSMPSGAHGRSLELIEASLAATRTFLGSTTRINWSQSCYQYANRLAHLYLLRELNRLDAYLVFIYFLNDEEMGGPRTVDEWNTVIELAERSLGICGHRLSQFAPKLFIDVNDLGDG